MSRPSRTATFVALARALETSERRRTPLFHDPLATRFLTGPFALAAKLAERPFLRPFVERALDRRAPGARTSAIARTRFIDDAVRAAVAEGARDVVILGAGFDCRAHRLEELATCRVFEVDRRETQTAKRAALTDAPGRAAVTYVEVDFLRDALLERLELAGFSTSARSVFVWEGVTSYLDARAVDAVLEIIGALAPGTRLVFTYLHRGAVDGTIPFVGAEKTRREVAALGEPWTFGFLPHEVPAALARHGLRLHEDVGANEYRSRYPEAVGLGRGGGYGFYRVVIAEAG